MAKLTTGQLSFLHDEPNIAVVAALRPDGTPHQTVAWIDVDGRHVLVNLNMWRTKRGVATSGRPGSRPRLAGRSQRRR